MDGLAACYAENPGRAKQIDRKLADEPWENVAQFAASCVQSRSLDLPPGRSRRARPIWNPPCASPPVTRGVHANRQCDSQGLLLNFSDGGLSPLPA